MSALASKVYVIDDDADLAHSIGRLLERRGYRVEVFTGAEEILRARSEPQPACALVDVMLGDQDGFAVADLLRQKEPATAVVFMTAWPKTMSAVDAVRRHAGVDYLEKPIDEGRLFEALIEGLSKSAERLNASLLFRSLSSREREVLDLLVQGNSNKAVGVELQISVKTVENHRAAVMQKTGASCLADLIRLYNKLAATSPEDMKLPKRHSVSNGVVWRDPALNYGEPLQTRSPPSM